MPKSNALSVKELQELKGVKQSAFVQVAHEEEAIAVYCALRTRLL